MMARDRTATTESATATRTSVRDIALGQQIATNGYAATGSPTSSGMASTLGSNSPAVPAVSR